MIEIAHRFGSRIYFDNIMNHNGYLFINGHSTFYTSKLFGSLPKFYVSEKAPEVITVNLTCNS